MGKKSFEVSIECWRPLPRWEYGSVVCCFSLDLRYALFHQFELSVKTPGLAFTHSPTVTVALSSTKLEA